MRLSRSWRCADRAAQFEPFEPRLLMAADPAGDFYIDYFVEDQQHDEIWTMLGSVTPSDGAHDLTGLSQARAEYGLTGSGQTVAVIDTGIAYDHVALGGGFGAGYRVVGGFDFSDERDNDPYDDGPYGSHGTHVAGIIGSDDAYYPGVAPGVDLVGLRVFDDEGQGHFSWVEEALAWVHNNRNAFDNPITTVNLSLGTNWNADSPPDWATLEDDFARLEADGIFVAVAAGNGYVDQQQVGLNYPAASPHVVPVGAVDDDGGLSYFSQRHPRMIAAPGRSVRSTVPDYEGNRNGIADDFSSYSGTSMAAPYVAGAAVLLREAYEFAGLGNVTQDTIYDLMVSSADTIVDPGSGASYHRLNIDRALDWIMPADDFGSSRSDAYQLGTLTGTQTLAGTIGALTDHDWFSFTAGATGSVHLDLIATGQWTPQWEMPAGCSAGPSVGTFSLDVVAGQTYALGLATGSGLGRYTLELELDALPDNTDWGTVDQQSFDDYRLQGSGLDFTLAAATDGILTIEAFFSHAEGDVDLELYAADGALLATSYGIADTERIDMTVSAGDTFRLRAYVYGGGSNDDVDFRVTNLAAQSGGLLHVGGTAGDDQFTFAAGTIHQVTVNGTTYEFPSAVVDCVAFDGGAGDDSITLTGTAGDDQAVLRSGSAELTSAADSEDAGSGYRAVATGVENVTIHGGGGTDRAVFYDSAGNDTFIAQVGRARMFGSGYRNVAFGFHTVDAYASSGKDIAQMYDSKGDDLFIGRPQRSTMSGDGFKLEVHRFDKVNGYSINGGFDVAKLIDSADDDLVVAKPKYATMYGDKFFLRAKKFDQVHAYSINGGYDVAKLIDSAGDDSFYGSPVHGILSGNDFYSRAKYFDEVHAYALNGGYDRAELADSAGDDVFIGTPVSGALRGIVTGSNAVTGRNAEFYNRAKFFEQIEATSTGGNDRAMLQPSGNALLEVSDDWARLSFGTMSQYLSGFNHAEAQASDDGTSTKQIAAHDFILVLEGVWLDK